MLQALWEGGREEKTFFSSKLLGEEKLRDVSSSRTRTCLFSFEIQALARGQTQHRGDLKLYVELDPGEMEREGGRWGRTSQHTLIPLPHPSFLTYPISLHLLFLAGSCWLQSKSQVLHTLDFQLVSTDPTLLSYFLEHSNRLVSHALLLPFHLPMLGFSSFWSHSSLQVSTQMTCLATNAASSPPLAPRHLCVCECVCMPT